MNVTNDVNHFWFQHKKYLTVDSLIDSEAAKEISSIYVEEARADTENKLNDSQCPTNSKAWYGQPMTEFLMLDILPKMEELTGLKLFPTYSYMRVYGSGEVLERHTDRPSCEVSVTVNLGQSSDYNWPIWIQKPDDITEKKSVDVKPCAGMIYRGMEVPHWREEFQPERSDDWQVQAFLHYVDAYGPHANWALDNRDTLFIDPVGSSKEYLKTKVNHKIVERVKDE